MIFNRTTADANGINTWYWGIDAVMLVLVGVLSDRLRVRKPFMLVGAVGAIVVTMAMISQVNHPHTGYYSNVTVAVLMGLAIACAYTPWMASYTEQVEAHNPALSATGLAVWGWVLRIVVALSFVVLPRVITTSTVLVDNQAAATNLQTFQAAQPYVPAAGNLHPRPAPASVITALKAMEPAGPGQALAALLQNYGMTHNVMSAMGAVPASLKLQVQGLLAFSPLASDIQAGRSVSDAQITAVHASSPQLASLLRVEPKLIPAAKGVSGAVEAVVVGVRLRPARVPGARVLHAGSLEPEGRQDRLRPARTPRGGRARQAAQLGAGRSGAVPGVGSHRYR